MNRHVIWYYCSVFIYIGCIHISVEFMPAWQSCFLGIGKFIPYPSHIFSKKHGVNILHSKLEFHLFLYVQVYIYTYNNITEVKTTFNFSRVFLLCFLRLLHTCLLLLCEIVGDNTGLSMSSTFSLPIAMLNMELEVSALFYLSRGLLIK